MPIKVGLFSPKRVEAERDCSFLNSLALKVT
jgi:hypothetical protein